MSKKNGAVVEKTRIVMEAARSRDAGQDYQTIINGMYAHINSVAAAGRNQCKFTVNSSYAKILAQFDDDGYTVEGSYQFSEADSGCIVLRW
jgi:hypothetical protein